MATRKRTSSRSSGARINQAVKAGRTALRQAEKRIPPDVRRQLEKTIRDGQVRFDKAVKDVRTRVTKAAGQADLDRARKNLEGLSKQVQDMVRAFAQRSRGAATPTAKRTTARRTAPRKAATKPRASTRKATTTRKPAARKTAPRRATTRRREPMVRTIPPAVMETPGPIPERVEMPGDGA